MARAKAKQRARGGWDPRSMTPIRSAAASGSRSNIWSAHDKPWVPSPQRLAAPGQARIRHEVSMGGKGLFIGWHTLVVPRTRQAPALHRIAEVRDHDFVQHL